MIGTLLNALGILAGGAAGLTVSRSIPTTVQSRIKICLGALTVWVGLSLTWKSVNGPCLHLLKQMTIVVVALGLGNVIGKLLRIQRGLNQLGRYAKRVMARSAPGVSESAGDGFVTCTLLFCVGPMAILGALQDGLNNDYRTLALKGLMDGLATMAFINTFGWTVMLSVIPVVAYQGSITLLAARLEPYLHDGPMLDSLNATGGLLIFCLAMLILELKKIEVADYLPSLALAPLLTWLWR